MLDRYERFSFYFCTFGLEIEVDGVFKPAKQFISVVMYPPKLIRELTMVRHQGIDPVVIIPIRFL